MMRSRPFGGFEYLIAWRYLRAKRTEGGVSVMTWISLVGIALAVAALVIVLAVRSGFRTELVDTIVGANAHVTLSQSEFDQTSGTFVTGVKDFEGLSKAIVDIEGVWRAAPIIRGQVMANNRDYNTGVQSYGIHLKDLKSLPSIAGSENNRGNIDDFESGIAIGSGVARTLGLVVGDQIKLISPNGLRTAFGVSPRVKVYTVQFIFEAGRWDIDSTRVYLPFAEAQSFFNKEGLADEIEVMVDDPDEVDAFVDRLIEVGGPSSNLQTWKQAAGRYLRALKMEDNVMFVIMAVLVLLSTMNIVSGLIMLVKNKGSDIGILRTIGMSERTITRVFFICGAGIGVIGTAVGVVLGVLFVTFIDQIFAFVNFVAGGGVWDPSIRGIYALPAELNLADVVEAVRLSLTLSFIITIFPARRAARLNPVEALRYE